ncbi:MAG: galactose ABC transporter substrate-binding protein [Acholeplasmatales bacterium]|jgi:methyl-galactoside transport system substrate-binding protein|nr:galactose ABC transporter substrate-binding protein [Acholeplasmatales bacterium]
MKKVLLLLSVLALTVVSLVACKGDDEFKVDIFIYDYADTYIGTVRTEIDKQLKAAGVEKLTYTFYDGKGEQSTQTTQIETAIANGSDLLVVNIVNTGSGDTVVKLAKDSKVPIIFFNREVSNDVIESYDKAAFVGTDPNEAGYMQGALIFNILNANYAKYDLNGDGKISYFMLRADTDNPEANGRTEFSVKEANRLLVAAGKPALVELGIHMAGWSLDQAKTAIDAALTAHPFSGNSPIELVIANNDDMALGAVQSLNGISYNNGDQSKTIPVVGVDATATAQTAIKAGKMAGSIKQDGDAMATCLVAFIKNANSGHSDNYTQGTDYTYTTVRKIRIPYQIFTA